MKDKGRKLDFSWEVALRAVKLQLHIAGVCSSLNLESPNAAAVEGGSVAIDGCKTHRLDEALPGAAAPVFRQTLLRAVSSAEHPLL
jgi:hypothetical protein